MKSLTPRQNEVLQFIREQISQGRPAPTIREIAEFFGFSSTRAVCDHLDVLKRKGLIRTESGKARTIQLIADDVSTNPIVRIPFFGTIPAGIPEAPFPDSERSILLDARTLGFDPQGSVFALRVRGDSMIGRGIHDDDIVIIDSNRQPREGDVVAALIDNQCTLKALVDRKGAKFLKSESLEEYELIPVNELRIQGVVRMLIREF